MHSELYTTLFVDVWPWWVAGPLIGAYTVAFFVLRRRSLGASGAYADALDALRHGREASAVDLSAPDDPLALPRVPGDPTPRWRLWWTLGLGLAGALDYALGAQGSGGAAPTGFDAAFPGLGAAGKIALLAVGGVLIGFGTRMAGGCTSGHAIFGISQRQAPSLGATAAFFASGMATSFLLAYALGWPR